MSRPGVERTCTLTSRATSLRQSALASATISAAPAARAARKVMIEITMTSERPAMESVGASGCSRGGTFSSPGSPGAGVVQPKALRSGLCVMGLQLS